MHPGANLFGQMSERRLGQPDQVPLLHISENTRQQKGKSYRREERIVGNLGKKTVPLIR